MVNRAFNASPALYAQKKRRTKASSARKKNKREMIKEMQSRAKKQKRQQKDPRPRGGVTTTGQIPDPVRRMQRNQPEDVPRPFLVRTASSHAYVAKCAVMDERTGEVYVDPGTFFPELVSHREREGDGSVPGRSRSPLLPQAFRNSHFEYFPPSAFPNYEPPWDGTPEVAFLGRSNTGKSSLINALSSLVLRAGG
eukprot:CAMPEP_0172555460 /NCGR_PEP_ID=MMETSP1067-20121228/58431_1 /TAXON_ID=265564 ORGANISM="Thalassiosira punctigera, Strain Tpunct2005C2" /NCGR_SAMPLE_ID=MMETSP1067 /ASSEMBLY_ACC=CAM_ASM_000444 /LENGTH=194 /DNA_ID=CAMNT_0013343983 /DNA_START=280 /DNA_END=860 /DNA_ORIENTATION=+